MKQRGPNRDVLVLAIITLIPVAALVLAALPRLIWLGLREGDGADFYLIWAGIDDLPS